MSAMNPTMFHYNSQPRNAFQVLVLGSKSFFSRTDTRLGRRPSPAIQFRVFQTFVLVREAQGRPVFENNDHEEVFFHFSSRTKTVGIILAAVYGFVALIAFTGFVGAIRKRASYVRVFSSLLQGSLALQVVLVIAYFVLYFADKDEFKKICIGQSTDQKVIDNCNDLNKGKNVWAFVVAAIIPILSQAYGVYIVSSYAKKLRNEEFLDQESFGFKGPGYAPVSEESHPLTHQGPYPYADNSHSFGGKA